MRSLLALFISSMLVNLAAISRTIDAIAPTTEVFDQYGEISWENEKARLDNLAIQLQNDERLVGYVVVFDAVGGCPGEAQARAIRAKRYVVDHRGIASNRVIWRRDGYLEGLSTILQPVTRDISLPFPLLSTVSGRDGVMSRRCKARLTQIRNSRW